MKTKVKNKISLFDLEYAIQKNCQVDEEGEKRLYLVRHSSHKNRGLGRSLFMYFGLHLGFDRQDIGSYLDMTDDEWYTKFDGLDKLYSVGREDFYSQSGKAYHREDIENTSLFFYRKYLLISHYLKYQYGVVV